MVSSVVVMVFRFLCNEEVLAPFRIIEDHGSSGPVGCSREPIGCSGVNAKVLVSLGALLGGCSKH